MFRTVPPPQGDPCRRHDGTSLPHTAMSVGFLQPQKKRTVPPSVLYISRLFKIYSRTVDRPPDGGAVARGWTATPRPPLDDEPPRRRRRGGPARCFLPHPTPSPKSSAQTRRSVCISSRRHSRFLDPGSFRNEFAYFVGTWRGPDLFDLFDLFDHRRGYPPWWWTDGQTDRSRWTAHLLAGRTNFDTLHSVLAAPPRAPISSRLAPVGHTTHAIHRRRRANDSIDDRGRCVLVSVDAVAPGPRGPRRSHCL